MSTKKKAVAKPAEAPAVTTPKQYPPANEFTDELLKELYDEFQSLLKSGKDPDRLAMIRKLGKDAQAYTKAAKAAPKKEEDAGNSILTKEETEHLSEQMNEVMTLVPPLKATSADVFDRINAELKDLHLGDFYPNADHPEKKIFDEQSRALIVKLGFKIPGSDPTEKPKAAPRKGKKEIASARQVIYKAWLAGEKDAEALFALVNEGVKKDTIRTYLSDWSHGKYLPAGVTVPKIAGGKIVKK